MPGPGLSNNQINETLEAAADLNACQYHFTRVTSLMRATLAGSLGNTDLFGVLQNIPLSGEAAIVTVHGMTPVVCGSSIVAGALVTVSASGRAITGAPSSGASAMIVGKLLTPSSADGDIATMWVQQPWRYTNPGY